MKPSSEDDLKDMFVSLDPPPGGLQRLRARLDEPAPVRWPYFAAAGLAVAAALVVWLRAGPVAAPDPAVAPAPAAAPIDLIAGRDLHDLDLAWVGLGRVAPPAEPMQLDPEISGALALRRVPLPRADVVLYMLDARDQVPEDMPD